MEGTTESHVTSAAAFVEGGIQEACDDACSICLEDFCESDPANVTNCKHEFHLQCILEWCQRSSQCPMCMQPISLKDATSQELLEAVELERVTRSRNAAIFHHPVLGGGYEWQQLPVGVNDGDIEQRIIQHLAAAAAMRRAHHRGQREGQRTWSSAHGHGRPHLLVFSTEPSAPDSAAGGGNEPAAIPVGSESSPSQQIPHIQNQSSSLTPGPAVITNLHSEDRRSTTHSSPSNQDRAGPSEFQSFSDSLRSRLNAASLRYKESISKGTRGWKERLFSRNSSMSELGSQVRRELNAGIASASRLIERLETRQNNPAASLSNHLADCSIAETSNQSNVEAHGDNSLHANNTPATCSSRSDSN